MTHSDQGLLGPGSVAWKVVGHQVSLVGGLRSLIVQSLHPLAMAGVAQHSDYRNRSLDRLRRTAHYVAATTFGDTETALAAAARVKSIHRKVRGTDPVTGLPYSADDPETQLWVHCVEWHSFLASYRAYGGRLTREEQDQYLYEGVRIAALLDVPEDTVPASVAEYRDYFEQVRPRLCVSESARAAIDFVMHPPMTRELLPLQLPLRVTAAAAMAIVPRDLRVMAGIEQLADRGHAHRGRGAAGRRCAGASASARGACHGGGPADVGAGLHAAPPCRVNILTLPITVPAKAINRALEDLSTLAAVARQLPERLDRLEERAEAIDERLENVMALGEAIETQGQRVADLGERIDGAASRS